MSALVLMHEEMYTLKLSPPVRTTILYPENCPHHILLVLYIPSPSPDTSHGLCLQVHHLSSHALYRVMNMRQNHYVARCTIAYAGLCLTQWPAHPVDIRNAGTVARSGGVALGRVWVGLSTSVGKWPVLWRRCKTFPTSHR
jgi:hypothetical protein